VEVEEYARIATAEDDHWWYRNTRALASDLLQPWLASGPPDRRRILDAGCGPGGNGAWLAEHGTLVGVDVSADALAFVRERRRSTLPVRGSLVALPFPDSRFDVVIAVTVLYTIDDDRTALDELARVLVPGGVLVVLEPAFDAFRREHDVAVHGRRRYRRAMLSERVSASGLTVQRATYAYSFLAPPAAVLSAWDRVRTPAADASSAPASDVERRALDRAFAPLARVERRYLARHDVPFGTTVIVVATAP
jgi:SAM-dependent methyltransferase